MTQQAEFYFFSYFLTTKHFPLQYLLFCFFLLCRSTVFKRHPWSVLPSFPAWKGATSCYRIKGKSSSLKTPRSFTLNLDFMFICPGSICPITLQWVLQQKQNFYNNLLLLQIIFVDAIPSPPTTGAVVWFPQPVHPQPSALCFNFKP